VTQPDPAGAHAPGLLLVPRARGARGLRQPRL